MPRPGCEEVVLLTGFPSFHARRLLEELLRPDQGDRGSTFVHAVVQAKAMARARDALDVLPLEQRGRVNLLEGDAASMDLGLSGAELRGLAREVDRIHHAAQVAYLGVDRKTAEHVNVDAVREVLEFARICPALKCLVAHSTAMVAGDRAGVVLEGELKAGQTFRNVVEETRARGERMLRAAMDSLPIAVLRPSIVIGDSTTGEIDRFDGPYLLFVLILTTPPDLAIPLPGPGDAPLPLVPVDYVARAACRIGRDARAPGRTFHVVDPAPLARAARLRARRRGRRTQVAARLHPRERGARTAPHPGARAVREEPARALADAGHRRHVRRNEHERAAARHRHSLPSARVVHREAGGVRAAPAAREAGEERAGGA